MLRPAIHQKEGWEFCHRDCGLSNFRCLEKTGVMLPMWYSQFEFCIKHRDSGITFDSIPMMPFLSLKRREQAAVCFLLASLVMMHVFCSFPSYGSPLRQVVDHQFDCAYVGDVFIEKPGEERQSYCASWEDFDWKTLPEQIDWITASEKISRLPITRMFNERSASKREKYKKTGLIVNHMELFYDDNYPAKRGNGYCYFNLVVTDCGWFASLQQLFGNCYGDGRIREMTMHCNFNQNVVYREIMERQTKDFEKNINFNVSKASRNSKEIWDDEMCVLFHEAKQFKIREAYMGESTSCTVGDARRYSSFTVDEWKETSLGAWDVLDEKIKSLFDNCGKKLQSIEARTGTRIQVVPLFRHPYIRSFTYKTLMDRKAPRSAYILGSDEDVERARSCLAEFLGETSQLRCAERKTETDTGPPSSHDIMSGVRRMALAFE